MNYNCRYFATSQSVPENIASSIPPTLSGPRYVSCGVCGRKFGTKSIKIHEPQCLKKWHSQNDHLPPNERELMHRDMGVMPQLPPQQKASPEASGRSLSSKKKTMFPCYLCGRLFSVNSIYIHEPQCLKKWKIENDKLPPNKKRLVPKKPDIIFTQDGKIDQKAINDANWLTHLNQLVPCKLCGRTFIPDRVEIHERSCKG